MEVPMEGVTISELPPALDSPLPPSPTTPETDPGLAPASLSGLPVAGDDFTEDDEPPGEWVELTQTGLVRLYGGDGRRWRLRRPFLGEFKRIRHAIEAMRDDLIDLSATTEIAQLEVTDLDDLPDDAPAVERIERRASLRKRTYQLANEVSQAAETMRHDWWSDVFALVSMDGPLPDDDQLPTWIVDDLLPARVMAHWRSAPLAHGGRPRR